MSKTPKNPKFIFLTFNFSCNDNNIFEDLYKILSKPKSEEECKKTSHLRQVMSFYSIEHDDTPNKHLHSVFKCPNQAKPENFKRSFMTQYHKYMKDKYHSTQATVAIDFQVISDPEVVQQKREYIFKDYHNLKRYNTVNTELQAGEMTMDPLELYNKYWIRQNAVKSETYYDIPIICLTSKTILRHTIDFYLKHIDDYKTQKDLKDIFVHMIKQNYSFINCSKYVKEQTIYELVIRYYPENINISNNNIYDTEHKQSFHSDNIFRIVSRILWSIIPYEQQKQIEESSAFENLFKYPSQFIEDELE